MNVPPVDENLYIKALRSGNIPYDTRHRQLDSQNSRGQRPKIPPRQSSLETNCKWLLLTYQTTTM